jgi:hypothetical protein
MATVADLIRGAFRVLGVLAAEETPSAAEQADGLETLNDMLDSWAGERLILYATLRSEHTLTASLNPHTIGTSGTFNTTRPVRIDRASIVMAGAAGTERPLDLLTDAEWQNTQGKTSVGTPISLWVETAYPLAKLWFNPIPNAADTLVLYTWQQLGRFASTATTVDLPPGYSRALRYNLAQELAPEYGVALSAEAAGIANESKATLKRLNHKPSFLRSDAAVLQGGGGGGSGIMPGSGGTDYLGGLF